MELRQLEYFMAVAEEASFTKAAARVHVAQPGVSAQVRRLERELGQSLFDRSGRRVRLTEVGTVVLPYARAALDAVGGLRLSVADLTGLTSGHLHVGMVVACGPVDVPDLLAGFHHDHPGVEISLSEANSDSLIESLQAGRLDLAIVALGVVTPPGIEAQTVVDEALVAVVSHRDPFAGRGTITLRALNDRPLISLPLGTGLRSCLDEACATAGVRPRIAFEATDPHVLARLAGLGLGVAIVPESTAEAHGEEVAALMITRPRMRGRLALAWRAAGASSPAAKALLTHARLVLAVPT